MPLFAGVRVNAKSIYAMHTVALHFLSFVVVCIFFKITTQLLKKIQKILKRFEKIQDDVQSCIEVQM